MPKKIRVYELAKELGLTNKEGLELALSLGIGVKSHSSSIEDAQADRVRRKADAEGLRRPVQPEEPAPAAKAPARSETAAPRELPRAPGWPRGPVAASSAGAVTSSSPAKKAPAPVRSVAASAPGDRGCPDDPRPAPDHQPADERPAARSRRSAERNAHAAGPSGQGCGHGGPARPACGTSPARATAAPLGRSVAPRPARAAAPRPRRAAATAARPPLSPSGRPVPPPPSPRPPLGPSGRPIPPPPGMGGRRPGTGAPSSSGTRAPGSYPQRTGGRPAGGAGRPGGGTSGGGYGGRPGGGFGGRSGAGAPAGAPPGAGRGGAWPDVGHPSAGPAGAGATSKSSSRPS